MGSASQELAVARVTGPAGGTAAIAPGVGAGRWWGNNNIIILIILAIIFFGFFGGNFGFGNCGRGCDPCRKDHHHHHHHHDHHDGGNNFFFGENGWFILIIFAALFLLNDGFGGANTNIINVDTDDAEV